ncbi:hypothetical protein [Nocardia sp. NPDC050710]|uniref:hypothetical protein n=1 Tax=Nocardia sp. NPDC050710 TaxID=3157220 RepID=UPI003407B3A9
MAEAYWLLHDSAAVRQHVAAGLAENPVHSGLLQLKARMEFENFTRDEAVATLRGLLGSRPEHTDARRLLAEIMWRALLRLAAWSWFFACFVVVLSMWVGPGAMRLVSPALFFGVLVAWSGVFRKLRRQLPPRYLRTRLLRRPEAIIALVILLFASLIADLGAVVSRVDGSAGLVRAGYVLLVAGVLGSALSHLMLFVAWVRRRDGETDRSASEDFAGVSVILVLFGGLLLLGLLAAVRHWSRQPAAFGATAVIVGVVGFTFVLELLLVFALEIRMWGRPVLYASLLLTVGAVMWLGIWWGAHIMAAESFGSDGPPRRPAVPEFHPRPLPTLPSFRVTPPVTPPPTGDR